MTVLSKWKIKNQLILILCLVGFHSICAYADPAPTQARLESVNQIQNLTWDSEDILVETSTNPATPPIAILQGSYHRNEWSLIAPDETAYSDQSFTLRIPLKGKITDLEFNAVGPFGETEYEKVQIIIEEAQPESPSLFSVGTGLTTLSMTQTSKPNFSMFGITVKSSYQKRFLSTPLDGQISGFITALSLARTPSDRSARFAGFNFRLGYLLYAPNPKWSVSLALGGYFATTWVSPNDFGFSNVYGPQLFPVIKRKLRDEKTLNFYFKISPVTDGFSVLSLSSRELATGLALDGFKFKNYNFALTLDVANLILNLSGATIQSTSTTLGASLHW